MLKRKAPSKSVAHNADFSISNIRVHKFCFTMGSRFNLATNK